MSTYSQVYIQVVFSVQNRTPLLAKEWREQLYKYIITIIQKHKHKVYAIGGIEDHVHIFFSQNISHSIPNLMMELKRSSSKWINENRFTNFRFEWQEGYGAFSYNQKVIDEVVKYIHNQEHHHKTQSSRDEFIDILNKFDVIYDEKYV